MTVLARLRDALGRVDGALLTLRDTLTPGQRWTSALLASVALAVLLAGAPTRTIVRPNQQASASTPAGPSAPRPSAPPTLREGVPDVAVTAPVAPLAPTAEIGPAPSPPAGTGPPPDEPAPPPDEPNPPEEEDDGGDGDDGAPAPPPCPNGTPLVVAEAGLCRAA